MASVTVWLVLLGLKSSGSSAGSGKYIVLNQATEEDPYNSSGDQPGGGGADLLHEGGRLPGPRIMLVRLHWIVFTLLAVLAVVDLALVFLPFSPVVHVFQMLLFQVFVF